MSYMYVRSQAPLSDVALREIGELLCSSGVTSRWCREKLLCRTSDKVLTILGAHEISTI